MPVPIPQGIFKKTHAVTLTSGSNKTKRPLPIVVNVQPDHRAHRYRKVLPAKYPTATLEIETPKVSGSKAKADVIGE
jgi:hypothetical protein